MCAALKLPAQSADSLSMDISAIASLSTQMSQQRASDAAALLVFKKALNMQQSAAMTLISSVTPATSLPPHLGQNVNTVA